MNADKAKVMVIDDEIGTRESIRMILKDKYDVVTADDPIRAVETLPFQSVNVVISDIRMPQMNGIEVLKKIKESVPNTEVIMITAYASFPTAQEALKYEALDYLLKPFSRKDVENAVEKALERQAQKVTGKQSTEQVKVLMNRLRDLSEENQKLSVLSEREFRSAEPETPELNSKAVELSIVQTISKAVLSNLDLYELLKSVIDQIHNGLGYDNTAFFLLNEQKQELEGVWENDSSGNIRDASDQALPLTVVPRTIELSRNERGDPQLSCPIQVDDKLVGMLRVDNGLSRKKIDDVELNLISMLAEYIAIALKNAKQYQTLKEHTEKLTAVNEKLQQEITDRVRIEKALQESNRRLEETLSELKQTQESIIQHERLRALGEMASGITHDFNNALMPILGTSELLLNSPEKFNDVEQVARDVQRMNTSAQDAANVVRRLREFYRHRESGEIFSSIDLNHLVEQVVLLTQPKWRDLALASGVDIEVKTDLQSVPIISGSATELREVLMNLIFNAVDAMPEGGTITLQTRTDSDQVVLAVSDTGVGMTEEVRQRCLEPFFSTKGESGTGMGLAMAYGSIRRHGGRIDIQSQPGAGTTFTVYLQVQTQTSSQSDEIEVQVRPFQKLHVLVVEDAPSVREIVAAYLAADGHTFELATNGREGFEKFQKGKFDIVVTDKAMPEMNGDQLASAIKRVSPGKPVVLLTGFGDLIEAADEHTEDVDVVISKPVTLAAFQRALAQVLNNHSAYPAKIE
ncbi:MAG: response regulator [Candidatus Poribacteria bacterium]|nr:response regulator [Candidatus Poribacteria bacterium]